MYKYSCELIELGLCTGCTRSLAEPDWVGKYQCKYYQEMKKKLKANKKEGN